MVFIIWGRDIPLTAARIWHSRLFCVPCDLKGRKGWVSICNIFVRLTYVEP